MANIDVGDIQLIAMGNVEDPDWKAEYRRICRWYSEKFATPLHYVEHDLNAFDVLLHYFEHQFSELKSRDSEEARMKYEQLKEDVVHRHMREAGDFAEIDEEDDDWAEQLNEEYKRQLEADKAKENPNIEEEMDISVQGEDATPPEFL